METTRRGFVGLVTGSVLAAALPSPLAVVRPAVDMDLCFGSLLHAMSIVGDGPYTLRVPPEGAGWARHMLVMFLDRDLGAGSPIAISVERLDQYVDSWALDNGRVQFYTVGA